MNVELVGLAKNLGLRGRQAGSLVGGGECVFEPSHLSRGRVRSLHPRGIRDKGELVLPPARIHRQAFILRFEPRALGPEPRGLRLRDIIWRLTTPPER